MRRFNFCYFMFLLLAVPSVAPPSLGKIFKNVGKPALKYLVGKSIKGIGKSPINVKQVGKWVKMNRKYRMKSFDKMQKLDTSKIR